MKSLNYKKIFSYIVILAYLAILLIMPCNAAICPEMTSKYKNNTYNQTHSCCEKQNNQGNYKLQSVNAEHTCKHCMENSKAKQDKSSVSHNNLNLLQYFALGCIENVRIISFKYNLIPKIIPISDASIGKELKSLKTVILLN